MTTFRARYDGTVIVPEEAVDLPVGEAVTLSVTPVKAVTSGNASGAADQKWGAQNVEQPNPSDLPYEEWLERYQNAPRIVTSVHVPLEAMGRETIYE